LRQSFKNSWHKTNRLIVAALNLHFGNYTTKQARNHLGTPGGEEFSESGANFLNYVQYFQTMSNIFFQWGRKIF